MRNPIARGYFIETDTEIEFVEDPQGRLRIYEWPRDDIEYALGADVAEGVEKDESAAVVLDVITNNTVAAYSSGKIDPDQFAIFLKQLGIFFNYAFVGIERNNTGFSVVSDFVKIYPSRRQYFHTVIDEKTKKETQKFGWITNERTRHLILADMKQEIREGSTDLRDRILIQQGLKFQNIDGKPQAAEGEHDDLVMARAIAGHMRRIFLSKVKLPKEAPHAERLY